MSSTACRPARDCARVRARVAGRRSRRTPGRRPPRPTARWHCRSAAGPRAARQIILTERVAGEPATGATVATARSAGELGERGEAGGPRGRRVEAPPGSRPHQRARRRRPPPLPQPWPATVGPAPHSHAARRRLPRHHESLPGAMNALRRRAARGGQVQKIVSAQRTRPLAPPVHCAERRAQRPQPGRDRFTGRPLRPSSRSRPGGAGGDLRADSPEAR
jgi:hypothetical protein